jgi:transcriptional regulator with XRE-family HTH domain
MRIVHESCIKSIHLHRKFFAHRKSSFYAFAMATEHYKIESGKRLRAARLDRNLELQELSVLTSGILGVSRISNYEQGLRYMSPDAAHLLARALNVRASWLMAIDDEDSLTPAERQLMNKFRLTDARGRKQIQSIADSQPEVDPSGSDDHPTTPPFVRKRA